MKEKLLNMSVQVIASSPAEFAAKIKADIARLDKVIKNAGIREEK
jgi:tripartite-type tricarboxylate transporter receptor subunit TctC